MEKTVYFRTFEEEDAPLIYQWMNDDEYWWAICAKDTNKMIGYMSLNSIHYINRSADFGGIIIGDNNYNDGFAWMESYLFIMEYAFEQLGMNRLYGSSIVGHKQSNFAGDLFLFELEGILRQAIYKNGRYYDMRISSILREEYNKYKAEGEYEMKAILRRLRQIKQQIN